MIAEGGKAVSAASVGILMPETRLPRIPGDIGIALSWPFPVLHRLVRGQPKVGAILLECTNMSPYAADPYAATGLPVHSMHGFVCRFQASLRPPRFAAP